MLATRFLKNKQIIESLGLGALWTEPTFLLDPNPIQNRHVRIYRPCKTSMQSGTAATNVWKLDFDTIDKSENSLMGWSSSKDPNQSLHIKFNTRDDAIRFASRNGFDYWVDETHQANIKSNVYADNFKFSNSKLRFIRTK